MSVVPNDTNLKSNKGHFPIEPQLSGSFVPDSESLLTGIHDNPALSDESQSFHSLPSHDNSPSTSPSKGGSPDLPEPHGGHILDSAPSDMNLEPQPDHTVAYTRFPVAYPGLPPGFIPEFISWVTPPQQYLGQYGEIMPPTPFIPSSQLEPSGGSVFHPSILPPQPPPVIPVMEHIPERGWQMVRFASPLIQMASPLSTSATTSVSSRESSGDSIPHYIPTSPVNLYSHTVNQGSTTSLSSSQSSQSSPAFVSPTFAYVKQTPGMTPPYPLKYPPQPVLDSTSALPNPELVYPPGIGPGYAAYTSEPTLSTRQPELLKTGAGISAGKL
ncbi:hypothetical protein ARMSODRAFT_1018302 [Armillaria solidipes]|uniref:Uncharacterized protein n=1 Tax=Armillaria solidipes TaxID=1076256 RepID=A0A2H3C050_9AGAR|nr:hypothetical protein ARMSODRAFT_1018302 [Armillaria solidipes]